MHLIGDGDSSVLSSIHERVPRRQSDVSQQEPGQLYECMHQHETSISCDMTSEMPHTMSLVSTPSAILHSLHDEAEARSGYTASLDQLPEGLFFSVLRASDRIVSLAEQLVDNQTSNLAECYMGLRSSFDGGKVYNREQSGSFEGRCYAAGLRFQEGSQWITHTYEEVSGEHPPQPILPITMAQMLLSQIFLLRSFRSCVWSTNKASMSLLLNGKGLK